MLRAPMRKVENMQEQISNVSGDIGNSKKEVKGNARNQKLCNSSEVCF